MKLFYRVEFYFAAQWNIMRCGRWNENHETIESAREYLAVQLLIDEAERVEKPWTPTTKYRITDHLGAVHWPEERKAAWPPGMRPVILATRGAQS